MRWNLDLNLIFKNNPNVHGLLVLKLAGCDIHSFDQMQYEQSSE